MNHFLGLVFTILSSQASTTDCLSTSEIQAVIADFKVKAEPLLQSFPLPVSITYKDIPLLAAEHVNGYTDVMDKSEYKVKLSGQQCDGLLHQDELRLLLCHELGHLAGGAPYMTFLGHETPIISAEGQADFFATSSCLPAIFASDDNSEYVSLAKAQPDLLQLCKNDEVSARGLCMRVLNASLNFSRFVNTLPKDMNPFEVTGAGGVMPELAGQDSKIVAATLTRQYPSAQCRLQTMIAGFQCQAQNLLSNFSLSSDVPLTCGEVSGTASRPRCWYNPANPP